MSRLLKRVREWVSNAWNSTDSTSNSLHNFDYTPSVHESISTDETIVRWSPMGEFDRLPLDIIMLILKLLEPKEAATLSSVSKSWKLLVSCNKLWVYFLQNQQESWDSIFFAEIKLRSGLPLRKNPRQKPSFMQIYGQRAQVPGAIIIDVGAGYCKLGWSKYNAPSIRLATLEALDDTESSFEDAVYFFFAAIYIRMNVLPCRQPVIIATPFVHHGGARVSSYQFSKAMPLALSRLKVPAVCTISQASLAMFASRKTWGILVNIGHHNTHIFPITYGEVRTKLGVVTMGIGAHKLTLYLKKQMRKRNIHVSSLYTVRSLKENLCYVAYDYEAELLKDTEVSYKVDPEGWFTLKKERFQTGEILFHPRMSGIKEIGLHKAVASCMKRCEAVKMKTGHDWYKTIIVAGGTSQLPGLVERLEKELHDLLPPSTSNGIRVIRSPYGADAAWHGAKLVSNLSSFPKAWCLKPSPSNLLEPS